MWLEMYIGDLFIDRIELDYQGFVTVNDRQAYQERWAEDLYFKHLRKIKQAFKDPVFYVNRVPSRMNEINYEMSWENVINETAGEIQKGNTKSIINEINSHPSFISEQE